MKERPILFSAPMVRAILEGRKTQTRRVAKEFTGNGNLDAILKRFPNQEGCPYGQPGDRLWVRETWRTDESLNDQAPNQFSGWPVRYEADGAVLKHGCFFGNTSGKTRVAIHMPRWASRILLEITSVRAERLRDISQSDAMAEGAPPSHPSIDRVSAEFGFADFSRSWYAQLWEQINGCGSWGNNPWVWVIEFKRIEGGAE